MDSKYSGYLHEVDGYLLCCKFDIVLQFAINLILLRIGILVAQKQARIWITV